MAELKLIAVFADDRIIVQSSMEGRGTLEHTAAMIVAIQLAAEKLPREMSQTVERLDGLEGKERFLKLVQTIRESGKFDEERSRTGDATRVIEEEEEPQ